MSIISNTTPTVTVIIPTIGRPKFIVDTVRSVLAQDYSNLKVLISDNAPPIATSTVLENQGIADQRVSIVTQPTRMAFSEHMNACLALADGDFVMILSDDDQISRGYISELVGMFMSDSSIIVGFGQQAVITEYDIGLLPSQVSEKEARIFAGIDYLKGTLSGQLTSNVITNISLFARRADVLDLGGFKNYADGSHSDNFILWRLAMRGRVVVCSNRMLYRVYTSSHGLSTSFFALLDATSAYTRDCAGVLNNIAGLSRLDQVALIRLIKLSNFRLLRSRIRTIYIKRVSKFKLFFYIAAAIRFSITPTRFL
jgi:glycosyltransferase involved in cell wall biosynthesis